MRVALWACFLAPRFVSGVNACADCHSFVFPVCTLIVLYRVCVGVCSVVSSGLLNEPVSGLLGLAWQSIASSGATPFWENLYQNNAWDQPVMAFQLTRYQNDSRAAALEPGGTFTMGMSFSAPRACVYLDRR